VFSAVKEEEIRPRIKRERICDAGREGKRERASYPELSIQFAIRRGKSHHRGKKGKRTNRIEVL